MKLMTHPLGAYLRQAVLAVAAGACCGLALAAPDTPLQQGREYLLAANYPNNLNVIDAESDTLYKTCPLPQAFGSGTIQVSPDHARAYILNNHYGDLYDVELDTCKTVFHAALSQAGNERARAMFSIALSPDGKEIYSIVNPVLLNPDTYQVEAPCLQVYSTDAGLDAKPLRIFPAPRQTTMLSTATDGSLYVVGPDVYRMNVQTGNYEVAVPLRNWTLPLHGQPDVLYVWPSQRLQNTLNFLYMADRFPSAGKKPDEAQPVYGFVDIDLATGKIWIEDFGPVTTIYFAGGLSPKDSNLMYGVLKTLDKYDVKQQRLLSSMPLDHSYYALSFNKAGSKVYLGGTFNTVAVYDADSLRKIRDIQLPGGDMAITTPQIFIR